MKKQLHCSDSSKTFLHFFLACCCTVYLLVSCSHAQKVTTPAGSRNAPTWIDWLVVSGSRITSEDKARISSDMEKYVVSYLIKQNEKKIARINIQIYEPPGSTNVFQVKIGWVMTGSIGKGPQPPPPPIIPTSPQMIQIIDNNLFKGAGARSVEVTY